MTEKKLPVADVAARLGVSTHSLYAWIKRYSKPQEERQQDDDQSQEDYLQELKRRGILRNVFSLADNAARLSVELA